MGTNKKYMNDQERLQFQQLINKVMSEDPTLGRGPSVDLPTLGGPPKSDSKVLTPKDPRVTWDGKDYKFPEGYTLDLSGTSKLPDGRPIVRQGETPKAKPTSYDRVDQSNINDLFQEVLRSKGVESVPVGIPTKGKRMFEDFIDKTFKHEGGFTVDQGGATMMGITWDDNKDLLRDLGYTKETLKSLTKDDAKKIYKTRYYTQPGINKLPEDIQYYAFDFAVNSGAPRAIKHLQKVVGAPVDGRLGPETLKKVNDYVKLNGSDKLKRTYVNSRANFMKDLAKQAPDTHGKSLKGWMNRISALEKDINSETTRLT